MRTVFSGFGAGVMLLGAGAIIAHGADYSWTAGQSPTLRAPARHPVAAFEPLAIRMATFSADIYYHLALGTVGAGAWSGMTKATDFKGCLVQPPVTAGQHFRPGMKPGSSFNWGRVKPTFTLGYNHFYLPGKTLPSVEVASQAKQGTIQFPEVPTLNQKAPGPSHIIDDPKNAAGHLPP